MSSETIQLPERATLASCLSNNPSIRQHRSLVPNINILVKDVAESFARVSVHPNDLHWEVISLLQNHKVTKSLPAGLRQEITYDLFKGICACEERNVVSTESRAQLTQFFEQSLRQIWSE